MALDGDPAFPLVIGLDGGVIVPVAGGGSGYTGPLDIVPGAIFAYSASRALSAARRGLSVYTINNGSATQSFSSDATTGAVNADAITTFIGAGSGTVPLWNDQSGNAHDVIQATLAKQPSWVANSGANSRPTLNFTASNTQYLATPGNVRIGNSTITTFCVIKFVNTGNPLPIWGENVNSGDPGYIDLQYRSTNTSYDLDANNAVIHNEVRMEASPVTFGSVVVFDSTFTFGALTAFENGIALTITDDSASGNTGPFDLPLAIGGGDQNSDATDTMNGYILEVITYDDVLSAAEQTAIRRNMATWYGITVP